MKKVMLHFKEAGTSQGAVLTDESKEKLPIPIFGGNSPGKLARIDIDVVSCYISYISRRVSSMPVAGRLVSTRNSRCIITTIDVDMSDFP